MNVIKSTAYNVQSKNGSAAKKQSVHRNSKLRRKKRNEARRRRRKWRKIKRLLLELFSSLLIFLGLFSLIQFFTFSTPKMVGYSMIPTISNDDFLFVNKLGAVKRFKLIYYRDYVTGEKSIRRVIGLPGERLEYKNDCLFIDGQEVVERFLEKQLERNKRNDSLFTKDFHLYEITGDDFIPQGKYFVMGDNRPYATDSRLFRYVDEESVIGIVETSIFPVHQFY